jgi:hypothetical protein
MRLYLLKGEKEKEERKIRERIFVRKGEEHVGFDWQYFTVLDEHDVGYASVSIERRNRKKEIAKQNREREKK